MYVCMYVSGMSLSIYPLPDNFDMRGSRGGLGSLRVIEHERKKRIKKEEEEEKKRRRKNRGVLLLYSFFSSFFSSSSSFFYQERGSSRDIDVVSSLSIYTPSR